jgi:hypothetical protein
MKNSLNISSRGYSISHGIPKNWIKGDISSNQLITEVNQLINILLDNEFLDDDIINLRQDSVLNQLYLKFHKELEEDTGVVLLTKTKFIELNAHTKKKLFLNICKFFGEPVPINKAGEVIREVKDHGMLDSVTNPVRGHLTNQALAFHSDRADITAMLCESVAAEGGEFRISSSASLFNKLQDKKNVLEILSNNIPHDLRDEGENEAAICYHPIISYKNVFWVRYIRKFIMSVVRHGLSIDKEIINALDVVDKIINDDNFYQEIFFQSGDMIFFNNHLTLHSRNNFVDNEIHKRCLFRVWLSSEFTRPLPDTLIPIFHSIKAGSNRGGVR